jgi:hypothetical protein
MLLKFRTLFFTLIYFTGLQIIATKPSWLFLISSLLFLITLTECIWVSDRFYLSILPVIFTLSSISLLNFISLVSQQQIFIALASSMYYLSLFGTYRLNNYINDQTAKGMNMAVSLATIFFSFTSGYGIYLNFLVPLWSLMILYLMITLLISYQYFNLISQNKIKIWTYSFLLSLVMAELVWTMNFWPFGYLITGTIAMILYFILWDLSKSYLLDILSRKRVVANLILFAFMISAVLLSAKWIPVI